jgi:hypothetical protein
MSKFLLQGKGGNYWCGDGWWSRRKDQAKRFESREAAERERNEVVLVLTEHAPEPATAE